MSNDTNTKSRPTHRVFSVSKQEGDAKPFWLAIGSAWPHRDGKGFNLKLNACPLGASEIVIRAAKDRKPVAAEGGAR